ncbi:hypothetical protein EV421DRAFT_1906889 [Armillaria borealis]|uniref:RING-type domain-containing protein n=1 Tax=Armillaria borealis TaxID=47425 RepID=A0AA39MKB4_9AGAR|nr:hypothetical protein EV421DRAFT_1906889 [Armillaria borealis]
MGPQCAICLCDFTNPVCIPCGHVFCSECLTKFIAERSDTDSAEDGFKATCPFCREKFPIAIPNLRYLPEKFHPFVVDPLRKVFITSDNSEKLELLSRIENLEKEILDLKQKNASLESDRDQLQGKCAEADRLKEVCLEENQRLRADCTIAKMQASVYSSRVKNQEKTLDEVKRSLGIATESLERDSRLRRAFETPFDPERARSIGLPREFDFSFSPQAISSSSDSQIVSDRPNTSETTGLLRDLTLGGTDARLISTSTSSFSVPNPSTARDVTTDASRLEATSR